MSLTSALYTARNGLTTTQSMSQITADNVANAMTPGYVRRSAILVSTGPDQGGAVIGEVRREVDASLVRMSRQENSKMAHQQAIHAALREYAVYLGQPGDGVSPAEKFSAFQTSLTTLVNMPSSSGAQAAVVQAAEDLAVSIRNANDILTSTRTEVDIEIRYEVADLNQALNDIASLNQRKREFGTGNQEANDISDQIASLLDVVSGIADIRAVETSGGVMNVYTSAGIPLLEGTLVHDVTYSPGDGTILAGGQDITPERDGIRGLEQGSLVGLSSMMQTILPRFQLQLDEYASALITTFETSDASLSAGEAGLFTDNGSAHNPAYLEGLAGRLRVNDKVRSTGDAEAWRLRDGMSATSEGDAMSTVQILAFLDALQQETGADEDTGIPATTKIADFAAEFVSNQSNERTRAESRYNAASSAAEVVRSARQNAEGVNIDDEMQKLMMIEQSHTANTRMLQAVSEMLDTLLDAF